MNKDIRAAMLGDHEAAKRMTEAGVLVMQGDCLELLKDIPDDSVDMVLCDLPYGTSSNRWDKIIPFEPLWEEYGRITKANSAIVLFGCEPFSTKLRMSNIRHYKYDWIWDKRAVNDFLNAKKRPLKRYENICVFSFQTPPYYPQMEVRGRPRKKGNYNKKVGNGDGVYGAYKNVTTENNEYYPTDILYFSNAQRAKKLHPTQKPVPLLEYLIRTYTNPGMTVLDNCMGSGSTGVACVNTGRNFIGMELDPGYFEIAKKRIEEAQAQARLAWNTRAPILSAEEMEMLEGME